MTGVGGRAYPPHPRWFGGWRNLGNNSTEGAVTANAKAYVNSATGFSFKYCLKACLLFDFM